MQKGTCGTTRAILRALVAICWFCSLTNFAAAQELQFSHTATQVIPHAGSAGPVGATPFKSSSYYTPTGFLNSAVNGKSQTLNYLSTFNVIDVAIADTNGDAFLDIIAVTNQDSEDGSGYQIVVVPGLGNGSFQLPAVMSVGPGVPTSVTSVDLTNDGLADILVGEKCAAGASGCNPSVLFVNATAIGAAKVSSPAVSGTAVQRTVFSLGSGVAPVSLAGALLDVNLRGDFVVAFAGNTVGVVLQDVGGVFNVASYVTTLGAIPSPAVDALSLGASNLVFDFAGESDIFVATSSGIEIFENQFAGSALFLSGAQPGNGILATGSAASGVLITELQEPGFGSDRPDVAALSRSAATVTAFIANGSGNGYGSATTTPVDQNPVSFAPIKHLFQVGPPDLAIAHAGSGVGDSSITILQGQAAYNAGAFYGVGTGGIAPYTSAAGLPLMKSVALASGRIDAPNPLSTEDYVIAEATDAITGSPGGLLFVDTFANMKPQNYSLATAISAAGSFDATGAKNDLVVIEQSGSRPNGNGWDLHVVRNLGTLSPTIDQHRLRTIYSTLTSNDLDVVPTSVTLIPLNSSVDSYAVTIVPALMDSASASAILVAQNPGNGVFSPATAYKSYTLNGRYTGVKAIDLNRDGALDLVALDLTASKVATLRQSSPGVFAAAQYVISSDSHLPLSAEIADVNDDDYSDLVILSQAETVNGVTKSSITLLLGDGQGGLTRVQSPEISELVGSVGGVAVSQIVSDFNDDGFVDIAVLSAGGGDTTTVAPAAVTLFLNRVDQPGSFLKQTPIALFDTASGLSLSVDAIAGGPAFFARGKSPFGTNLALGVAGATGAMNVGDFNSDGSKDLVIAGALPIDSITPQNSVRATTYLYGDRTTATFHLSGGIHTPAMVNPVDGKRSYAVAGTSATNLLTLNGADPMTGTVVGSFGSGASTLDVAHLSLSASLWIDRNVTPISNHAPTLTIPRSSLNATIGNGRKVFLNSGESANIPFTAADSDDNPLTFELLGIDGTLPSFVTKSSNGNTGSVTISVPGDYAGGLQRRIAVQAKDSASGNLKGRDLFTLRVNPSVAIPTPTPTPPDPDNPDGAPACVQDPDLCADLDPCTVDLCSDTVGCFTSQLTGIDGAQCIFQAPAITCTGLKKKVTKLITKAGTIVEMAANTDNAKTRKKYLIQAQKTLVSAKEALKASKKASCTPAVKSFIANAIQRVKASKS